MAFQQNNGYVDSLLLSALRTGDEAALNHLFTTYYNRLFRTGIKYGAKSETVEEAIQSVFLDVWKYRQTLGEIVSFEAYLKGSLRKRLTKMAAAGSKDALQSVSPSDENDILLSVEAYEQILIRQETNDSKRHALAAALDQLSPRQKELIVLRYFEEMSYADIAAQTQLQPDSIYKTIHEALKRLHLILGD